MEQVSLQALLISLGASSDAYQGRTLSLAADASVTVPDGALLATASLSITQTYTPSWRKASTPSVGVQHQRE